MLLPEETVNKYKAMSKPYKSELKELFQHRFGYSSGNRFETLMLRTVDATPLQYEYIVELVERYHNFSKGVVQEANI
jgi:hypothetical protein